MILCPAVRNDVIQQVNNLLNIPVGTPVEWDQMGI